MNSEIDLSESKNLYLVIKVGEEKIATPILSIREILEPIPVSAVSNTIKFFKGIINIRGDVIGVIDLREKFKQSPATKGVFLIADDPSGPVAYVVDEIVYVKEINDDVIKSDIKIQHGGHHDYFKGVTKINGDIVSVIDFFRLFDSKETIEFKSLLKEVA